PHYVLRTDHQRVPAAPELAADPPLPPRVPYTTLFRSAGDAAASPGPPPPRRRRGQQPGRKSHPRRNHDHLPATDETAALPPDQCHCTTCGLPFAPCGSEPEVSTVLEVEVRAHRRLVRRRR